MVGRNGRKAQDRMAHVSRQGCAWAGNLAVAGMEQARHALEENDSYPILHHCGALLRTGPTRTNVMDLAVLLVWPEKAQ